MSSELVLEGVPKREAVTFVTDKEKSHKTTKAQHTDAHSLAWPPPHAGGHAAQHSDSGQPRSPDSGVPTEAVRGSAAIDRGPASLSDFALANSVMELPHFMTGFLNDLTIINKEQGKPNLPQKHSAHTCFPVSIP